MEGSTESNDEIKDGLVVLPVAESAKILESILLLCYPDDGDVQVGDGLSLDEIIAVIQATVKYDMQRARKRARNMLIDSRWIAKDPIRVLGLALDAHLEAEARLAAG